MKTKPYMNMGQMLSKLKEDAEMAALRATIAEINVLTRENRALQARLDARGGNHGA